MYVQSAPSRPIHFLVPLGVKALLVSAGIGKDCVYELDWWSSMSFPIPILPVTPNLNAVGVTPSSTTPASNSRQSPRITFTCTPTQHNSGRSLLDQGMTLWASWAVKQVWELAVDNITNEQDETTEDTTKRKGKSANVWFAGDTGYQTSEGPCPVFKGIPTPSELTD